MDRAQRLLPLETGTVGPAPGLPTPPRASGTQWTHSPTKWTTSPAEVDPNWDPGNWSLWKASGWKPTNLWSGQEKVHLKPGWEDIHLQPGQETGLRRQRWEASHLRGPIWPTLREGRSGWWRMERLVWKVPPGGWRGNVWAPRPSLPNWDCTGETGGHQPNLQPCGW